MKNPLAMQQIQIDWMEIKNYWLKGPMLIVHYGKNKTWEFPIIEADIVDYIPGGIEVWSSPFMNRLKLTPDRFREFIEKWLLIKESKQAA